MFYARVYIECESKPIGRIPHSSYFTPLKTQFIVFLSTFWFAIIQRSNRQYNITSKLDAINHSHKKDLKIAPDILPKSKLRK